MKVHFSSFILFIIINSFLVEIKCQGKQILNSRCHVENCISCQSDNINVCLFCREGYSGSDCKTIDCSKVEHCSTGCYLPNKCGECQVGYAGTGCWPIDCSKVKHCSYGCTSPNVCGRCDFGYSGHACNIVDCSKVSNCKGGCSQPNICKSCDSGYTGTDCLTPVVTSSNQKQDYLVSQSGSTSGVGFTTQSDSKTTSLTIGLVIVSILLMISLIGLIYSFRKLRVKGKDVEQSKKEKDKIQIPPSSTGMINANECIQ